ncbi:DNA replication/repair protein RecF [Candidatus Poribacteria bacterium]|nr:DNA replication/repair protein RecF [Candidatus Poribacteria bacterium]
MRLNHLVLRNFRNYVDCEVDFPDRVNLIIGENAQGKTSLLEAVYFLSTAKSHRTYPDDELIRHNENWFYLKGIIASTFQQRLASRNPEIPPSPLYKGGTEGGFRALLRESGEPPSSHLAGDGLHSNVITVEASNELGGKKRFRLNGTLQQRLSQWIGQLNVIFFSPESLTLVKGGPSDRRRFIDMLISQISSAYLNHLQNYHFALKQRNELLKQIRSQGASVELLEPWETWLAEDGIAIIQTRARILARLTVYAQRKHAELTGGSDAQQKHAELTGGREKLELTYQPASPPPLLHKLVERGQGVRGGPGIDPTLKARATEQFRRALEAARPYDLLRGTTSVGPHRDDFKLELETQQAGSVHRYEAKSFCSQGQQRTIALALKLGELELMCEETNQIPIVLLDDVASELDEIRSTFLLSLLQRLNAQTFITSTRRDVWTQELKEGRVFTVQNGQII